MNRREALAAILALPEVGRVSRLTVRPNEAIVIECPGELSQAACERLRNRLMEELRPIFPDTKILVFTGGITLKILEHA